MRSLRYLAVTAALCAACNDNVLVADLGAADTTAAEDMTAVIDLARPDLKPAIDLEPTPDLLVPIFPPAATFDCKMNGPQYLVARDFDRDGNVDLIVTSYHDSAVCILPGKGDGTFGARLSIPLAGGAVGVDVGDVDGDNVPDLVVGLQDSGQVALMLGKGGFVLGPATLLPLGSAMGPGPVELQDLNSDGRLDIVGTNFKDGTVEVLVGDGLGGFAAARAFKVGTGAWWMGIGDFNNDGLLDVVDADYLDGTVSVLINTTAGGKLSFAAPAVYVGSATEQGLAAGDADGDGFADVVVNDAMNNVDDILYGNAQFTLDPLVTKKTGGMPQGVAIAELSGDRSPDIATCASGENELHVALGAGGRSFQPDQVFPVGATPTALVVADFNNDGKPDVATANTGGTGVSVLLRR